MGAVVAVRVASAVFVGLFNAGLLALTTNAPNWAPMAVALTSMTIVVWSSVGQAR